MRFTQKFTQSASLVVGSALVNVGMFSVAHKQAQKNAAALNGRVDTSRKTSNSFDGIGLLADQMRAHGYGQ